MNMHSTALGRWFSPVAIALVVLLVVPIEIYNHLQSREVETKP